MHTFFASGRLRFPLAQLASWLVTLVSPRQVVGSVVQQTRIACPKCFAATKSQIANVHAHAHRIAAHIISSPPNVPHPPAPCCTVPSPIFHYSHEPSLHVLDQFRTRATRGDPPGDRRLVVCRLHDWIWQTRTSTEPAGIKTKTKTPENKKRSKRETSLFKIDPS